MKISKYKIFSYIVGVTLFASCKKSFLDKDPNGLFLESNYYSTVEEAFSGLIAAYSPLGWTVGGTDNTYISKIGVMDVASDECYAGGGGASDMPGWQALNTYNMSSALGPQAGLWSRNYTGINNANIILSKLEGNTTINADSVTRFVAEAKFLRAYYYFDLVREFKNIPLILIPPTLSNAFDQKQTSSDSVYLQIEADLKAAIPNLPETVSADQNGRATTGAANALLGKVILTENNTARMAEAASYLNIVNTSSQYGLLSNYADIFATNNKFNKESIFEIVHTSEQKADWGTWPYYLANVLVNMVGPRSYVGPLYWTGGYGFCPVTPNKVAALKGDPRFSTSIANIDSIVNAVAGRSYSAGYQNTGYFINKYAPLQADVATVGQIELNFAKDEIEIRLADTYLMEAEALIRGGGDAGRALALLTAVRARVGLSPVAATLDNIYHERELELAFEGHRWFDLVRTNQAASVLSFKGFKSGTNEILPIPLQSLNNTSLVQNPGY
ncbi:RagB/SusD family nutrient uptake outer membrane protein [Rhizosphaericola mali]|uniref:RagB/SusD family nutrient uptake outer membrane protein n=1 Tax=Rhizosphaericola mali TaxID=2545455 RepID=A0A5P2G1H3_9BACT|nr:RagB/SusD family nutrient uptake outer membrane protein [Rhizosphaericola mali]QES87690.1 RagB/SusD family nutrient uptake outer membrane protein [Rhizosphaericola mali]